MMVIRLSRPVECYNTAISKRWSLFRWRHQNEKLAVARNNISNIPSKTRLAFPPYIFYTSKYILYIIYNIIYIIIYIYINVGYGARQPDMCWQNSATYPYRAHV